MASNYTTDLKLDSSILKQRYKDAVFFPWSKQSDIVPLNVVDMRGVYLILDNGQRLIDLKSQAFCANLGHAHQGMINALVEAAKNVKVLSSDTICKERLHLAEELLRIAPKSSSNPLKKTFFTLGGAEANENAIKIARLYTNKHKIITRYRSYHGATLATINFSGDYRRIPFDSAMTGIVRFPDPYPRGSGQNIDTVRLLEEIIEIEGPETIAAIMLEGITGANGVFVPPLDYWPRIRELCSKHNILLIADEVLSGFFRTGEWFGIDHFKVAPDIMTISKGLTAGYAPLGALIVNKDIAEYFEHEQLWCGLTQYGHSLSCAAAIAAIKYYEEDHIANNVKERGLELDEMLQALKREHALVAETRSIGLLAAIDLKKSAHDESPLVPYRAQAKALEPAIFLQKALKKAGLSTVVRFSSILIAPPLVINKSELKEAMAGINIALNELRQYMANK